MVIWPAEFLDDSLLCCVTVSLHKSVSSQRVGVYIGKPGPVGKSYFVVH